MISTANKQLALEPFPAARGTQQVNTALKIAAHNNTLVRLKVVAGTEDYEPGDFVYVRGALSATQQAKETFTVEGVNEGKPFIVLPIDFIVLAEKTPRFKFNLDGLTKGE